ncbi:TrbC/VirB2 family protein [Arenibacter sp. 6A1]|uniref:TrbC/VirB2 family protein n=1 Tax=Arenibacter sp. 6A1 TaxID=2720391 RepID=UPI0021D38A8F|nr:TrbC/VirB2 family protein [Arenibacter sp. 6A1]
MKNSPSSAPGSPPRNCRRIPKLEIYLLLAFFLIITMCSYGQFDQLLQEAQDFKNDSKTLSKEIVDIIKIIAGVAIAITGLTYLYIRDQQTDLANKLGKIIIGIAIFFALIAIGEEIANI